MRLITLAGGGIGPEIMIATLVMLGAAAHGFGDILSDLIAELSGSPGLVCSLNAGVDQVMAGRQAMSCRPS